MSNALKEFDGPVARFAPAPADFLGTLGPRGRPSWSDLLRLSLVAVPIKAYPAVSSSATHFNQLHADCGQRIQHQKRCPVHGPVDSATIVRGFQHAPGQYLTIDDDEMEKIRPEKDKALILEHFVPVHQVDPVLYAGRSLYLLPDGPAARHPYGVIAQAMAKGGQGAIGRVVFSGNRHLVLVRSTGRLLILEVLHYPATVRASAAYEADLGNPSASAEELHLASSLIDAASGPFNWDRFRDTTAEDLTALLDAKLANQPLTAPLQEPKAVLQLLDALKQSVAAAQKNEPAAHAKRKTPSRRTAG